MSEPKMQEDEVVVDVEKIMQEIREQIKQMPPEPILDFSQIPISNSEDDSLSSEDLSYVNSVRNEVDNLRLSSGISYFYDLGTGIKSYIKRCIRKLNKFLVLPIVDHQNEFNVHATNGVDALRRESEYLMKKVNDLEIRLDEQSVIIEKQKKLIEEQNTDYKKMNESLHRYEKLIDNANLEIARVINHYGVRDTHPEQQSIVPIISANQTKQDNDLYGEMDYFRFQNEHRGSENEIMERQKVYVPYFEGKKGKIFDLGCGRGEFLRLMKENGIPAFGIDTFPEYEVLGKLYDIDIRTGDGIAYLENTKEKLGGIFCAQVIEHIGFHNIQKLCALAYQRLEDGACIIMETPNPRCVSTMTNAFYLDPTHDKPVHPMLMEYLLKAIGFSDVTIIYPDHSQEPLPHIKGRGISNLEEVNHSIQMVSDLLYGSQDYAIIARK